MTASSSYADDASNEVESEWVPAAASANVDEEECPVDEFGAKDFRSQMILRDDHEVRGDIIYLLYGIPNSK
jgi:hypothetical protein